MNVIRRLDLKLNFYDIAVQHVSHYARRFPLSLIWISWYIYIYIYIYEKTLVGLHIFTLVIKKKFFKLLNIFFLFSYLKISILVNLADGVHDKFSRMKKKKTWLAISDPWQFVLKAQNKIKQNASNNITRYNNKNNLKCVWLQVVGKIYFQLINFDGKYFFQFILSYLENLMIRHWI